MAIYQWGSGPCGCIDTQGVLSLPEGGAVAIEPDPAESGDIRLPNGGSIRARSATGAEDVVLVQLATDDTMFVADADNPHDTIVRAGTGRSVRLSPGATVVDASSSLVSLAADTAIGSGSRADTGVVRLPHGSTIRARNGGNRGDLDLLASDADDRAVLGGATAAARLASPSGVPSETAHALAVAVELGRPAQVGDLRLRNEGLVVARNGGDTADVRIASVDSNDRVYLGHGDETGAHLVLEANGTTTVGAAGNKPMIVSSSLVTVEGDLAIGSGTEVSSGAIRIGNDQTITARNAADSGDITLIGLNVDDQVVLGTNWAHASSSHLGLAVPRIRWNESTTDPTITQANDDTAFAVGRKLTVVAQACMGTRGAGGDLVLQCADGTDTPGAVEIADASGGSIMRATDSAITMADSVPFVNFANATWKKLLSNQTRQSTTTATLLGDLSFALEPGNYTFRIHIIVETPSSNNGGLRIGGGVVSGATPSDVSRLGSIIRVLTTSSSLITYQHSVNMIGNFTGVLTTSAMYVFVAEGAFTLSSASVYEVRAAQRTPTTEPTTYLVGSYAMFNKCSN